MKVFYIILSLLLGFINKQTQTSPFYFQPIVEDKGTFEVTTTMYYAEASQCDADPLVTAGMFKINPSKASSHKWIAMSRDLLARWGGIFKYGDKIKIEGADDKDGIYTVADCMNKRFKRRIDILETKGTKFYKFDKVKITKL